MAVELPSADRASGSGLMRSWIRLRRWLTCDVEEAGQEAVPESTHLVPQAFVDLQRVSVESNVTLLSDSKLWPALLAVRHPIMEPTGISAAGRDRRPLQPEADVC